ncbi:hypothetical protein V8G54_029399 [Vigna mungo]|uniref:Uncharacterized protein n=1 Tax=Vigna mungo TaxID=3915 RepID=A0AAQ3RJ53_VIGMU
MHWMMEHLVLGTLREQGLEQEVHTFHKEGDLVEEASLWQGWDQHHKPSHRALHPNTSFASSVISDSTFLGCQGTHKLHSTLQGTLAHSIDQQDHTDYNLAVILDSILLLPFRPQRNYIHLNAKYQSCLNCFSALSPSTLCAMHWQQKLHARPLHLNCS